ncbi:hypothetical protein AKJ51_02320 [candidate division MSBL1 archaeon SCGC-AAA382A20]|uniref:histidine kinase n=1 Tax=candidate division MSBL1 archaeon SCGC-AAA382A20 TaxID=1698280 RepID=A0A133VKP0_9EURY|nr:hypothetical protein AKJ51_02320 [candidate division MSBL1 archaeon SCGC-AAA382A20]
MKKNINRYLDIEKYRESKRKIDVLDPLILCLNRKGEIILFDEKCEKVTGYSEQEVTGTKIWRYFPEKRSDEKSENFFLSTEDKKVPNFLIIPWITKSGEKHEIKWRTIQFRNDKGNLRITIGIGVDLEETGDLIEGYEVSKVINKFLDELTSGIFTAKKTDRGIVLQNINKEFENLLNVERRDIKGERIETAFHIEDVSGFKNRLNEFISRGKGRENFQFFTEKEDGEKLKLNLTLLAMKGEENPRVFGILNKQGREEDERDDLKYYRAIVDNAKVGIGIVQGGAIDYVNQRLSDIFECCKENLKVEGLFNFVHPEDQSEMEILKEDNIEGKVPFTKEFRIITKKGKVRYLSVHGLRIEYNGEPASQLIIDDITKYKEMEKKLRDRREELSQAYTQLKETEGKLRERTKELEKTSETRSEFIDLVSHELSSLLTPAKTYLEMIRTGEMGEVNQTQEEKLSNVMERIENIEALVEDMLDLSRMEAGRIKTGDESVSIPKVMNSVVKDLDREIERKNHEVRIDIPDDLRNVVGNPRLLDKVFRNLVSNAVQYTPPEGKIEIKAKSTDNEVRISISDNGIGIPKEEQEKIFEKFYRVESAKHEEEGLGIGLALTKHFVELHEGEIWVESEEGKGSTFYVSLPISR